MLTKSKSSRKKNPDEIFDDEIPDQPKRRLKFDVSTLKSKPWWRLETALVAGAITAAMLSGFMSHQNSIAMEDSLARRYKTTSILVAGAELKAGSTIDEGSVRRLPALSNSLSKNSIPGNQLDLVLGHKISVDVLPGDPILLSMVQGARDAAGMAEKIPAGKRLFTLSIDSKAAGYGFVNPNDHVDILAQIELPNRGLTSFTLLQDITLVSVGSRSVIHSGGKASGTDVSFFVTPKEFELLAFAQKRGTFSLALRNPKDIGRASVSTGKSGVDMDGFLDHNMISDASGGGALEVETNGKVSKSTGVKGSNQ